MAPKGRTPPTAEDLDAAVAKLRDSFQTQMGDFRQVLSSSIDEQQRKLSEMITREGGDIRRELMSEVKELHEVLRRQAEEQSEVKLTVESLEAEVQAAANFADIQAQRWKELEDEAISLKAAQDTAADAQLKSEEDGAAQRQLLESHIAELRETALAQMREVEQTCHAALSQSDSVLRGEISAMKAYLETTSQVRLEAEVADLERRFIDMSMKSLADITSRFDGQLQGVQQKSQEEVQRFLEDARRRSEESFGAFGSDLQNQAERIGQVQRITENIHTRSVAWRINCFHKKLAALVKEQVSSITSPSFALCSLPLMRLELRLAGKGQVDDSASAPMPPLPGVAPRVPISIPGSCTLRLWAPVGLQLSFRLTAGEGNAAVLRRFEHVFQPGPLDSEGRSCFDAFNFCQLDNVFNKSLNAMQVGLEMLEFKFLGKMELDQLESEEMLKWQAAAPDSKAEQKAEKVETEEQEKEEDQALESYEKPLKMAVPTGTDVDEVIFTRAALSEPLMHERLQREILAVKNRSVRRVEWKLANCSWLLSACRPGEGIDSPPFSAAGLEKLSFHFYPRGLDPNMDGKVQFCGLFISGPSRTMLRAMLWVGSSSKHFEHRYEKRGEFGGRCRICSLENQITPEDTVTLAIDISEVEQDLPDQDHNISLVLREVRAPSTGPSSGPMESNQQRTISSSTSTLKSSMKMKREDPSKTEEFVKCVSLPTLNARQINMPIAASKSRSRMDI